MDIFNKQFRPAGDSFLIEHRRMKDISNISMEHFHDAFEIYYLADGERSYFIKDRTYKH